jgi:hypothetical protein
VLDGVESAGCAVVFAAGNEGSSANTLRTPADRIKSPVDTLAVAALLQGSNSIASYSSRGPSNCDGTTIKPDISAQGDNVRSSWVGGGYINISGTSMACPLGAGAVAELRQVNPNISSRRVKEILIETADDLGSAGDDNTYGHGRINLEKAYNQVIAEIPAVSSSLVTDTFDVPRGNTLHYFATLINHAGSVQLVDVRIEARDAADTLLLTVLSANNVPIPATFNNEANPFHFTYGVPASVPAALLNVPLFGTITLFSPGTSMVISMAKFEFKIS